MMGYDIPLTSNILITKAIFHKYFYLSTLALNLVAHRPVADPGFSPGGAPTLKVGERTYFFGRKPHENERILAPRGGHASLAPPLRSATADTLSILMTSGSSKTSMYSKC